MAQESEKFSEVDLPSLPGFNLEAALKRVNGKWHRLKKIILGFLTKYRDSNGELRGLLEDGQFEKARDLLHQIKGSGANLGAEVVAQVAAELETLLKAGVTELPVVLLDEFAVCIGQLAEAECVLGALNEGDNPKRDSTTKTVRGVSLKDIENCLREIEVSLQSDIGKAEDEIDVLMAHCRGSELESLAVGIQSEFNEFNLEQISQTINQYFVDST